MKFTTRTFIEAATPEVELLTIDDCKPGEVYEYFPVGAAVDGPTPAAELSPEYLRLCVNAFDFKAMVSLDDGAVCGSTRGHRLIAGQLYLHRPDIKLTAED